MKITAHSLVKNEGRFVWYSVMSVINYVDRVLLWDTGSTDGTIEILRELKKIGGKKVELKEVGEVDPQRFTEVRQEMLDATQSDWFLVVDGDEVWWDDSIKQATDTIKTQGRQIESIVVPTVNLIGDIYHYQEESAGQYRLAGRVGNLNLRGVNCTILGLHSDRPHGTWGWVDKDGKMVQDRDPPKIMFINAPYLHASFIQRSLDIAKEHDVPKRKQKLKYELGIPFPADYYYPEVFFRPRPIIVPSVWENRSLLYTIRASLETPLKMIKRRILPTTKVGY